LEFYDHFPAKLVGYWKESVQTPTKFQQAGLEFGAKLEFSDHKCLKGSHLMDGFMWLPLIFKGFSYWKELWFGSKVIFLLLFSHQEFATFNGIFFPNLMIGKLKSETSF